MADHSTAETVKQFVLSEFLPGERPDRIDADTELLTSGVLDSLAILKLVSFLEETYGIEIAAHEADEEHMNTIASICSLVESKRA